MHVLKWVFTHLLWMEQTVERFSNPKYSLFHICLQDIIRASLSVMCSLLHSVPLLVLFLLVLSPVHRPTLWAQFDSRVGSSLCCLAGPRSLSPLPAGCPFPHCVVIVRFLLSFSSLPCELFESAVCFYLRICSI